ncbi:pantoate--beta-alanine ligase [Flavobacteriales bacterium]|jgi:pantoate--beta-alanine ligase|nr:pantoate--beta-alanine ligase [Flavobacteriales bacterium]
MKVTNYKKELISLIEEEKNKGKIIGFVPTMGALHNGHLSLIKKASEECDIVVCSIFVNPTQFNESSDLDKYPRTLEADKNLIKDYCDFLFFPKSTEEVYGDKIELVEYDFGGLENELEGEFRPGHFQGMANVVAKFLTIVNPDKAYFGLKDFQQFKIVSKLVELIKLNTEIVGCKIIREENGLARSSRNELLSPEGREASSVISYALNYIKLYHSYFTVQEIQQKAKSMISGILEVEYLEIRDSNSLLNFEKWEDSEEVFVSFAGHIDGVRLIDNVRF